MFRETKLRKLEELAIQRISQHEFLGSIIPVSIITDTHNDMLTFNMAALSRKAVADSNSVSMYNEFDNGGEHFYLVENQHVDICIPSIYMVSRGLKKIITFIDKQIRAKMYSLQGDDSSRLELPREA
jgi:hypothetical protein